MGGDRLLKRSTQNSSHKLFPACKERTSGAKARIIVAPGRHDWKSCPSRSYSARIFSATCEVVLFPKTIYERVLCAFANVSYEPLTTSANFSTVWTT